MRPTLLLLCLASLAGACSTSKPRPAPYLDPAAATPTGAVAAPTTAPLSSLVPVRRGVLGWLPGRRVAATDSSPTRQPVAAYAVPRKCKGCTFNVVSGDQQVVGKKATAAAAGATALGTTTGQAQVGDGNQASRPADTKGGLLTKLQHLLGSAFDFVAGVLMLLLMLLVLFRKRLGFPF